MAVSCLYLTTTILWLVAFRVALTKGQDQVLAINNPIAPLTKNVDRTHKATSTGLASAFTGGEQESKQIGERVSGGRTKRKAIADWSYHWPDAIVPYKIERGFSSNDITIIKEAMDEFSRHTCLKFRKALPTDNDTIVFADGEGCSSDIGRSGGHQTVILEDSCRTKDTVIHEIGHAIGFFHEHARPDRDKYVEIHPENIEKKGRHNFDRLDKFEVYTYGIDYDHHSIMHYRHKEWTKNGKATITAKDASLTQKLGVTNNLSFRDIKLANLMYYCAHLSKCRIVQCQAVGFQGTDCNCKCPSPTRNEENPTVDCTPMDFKVRGFPFKGRSIGVVCAFPQCNGYKVSRKDDKEMPTISYNVTDTSYKVTNTSLNYEGTTETVAFTIGPLRCGDYGGYVCSCQPKNGGPRVSAIRFIPVLGC